MNGNLDWERHWEILDRVGRPEFSPDSHLLGDILHRAGVASPSHQAHTHGKRVAVGGGGSLPGHNSHNVRPLHGSGNGGTSRGSSGMASGLRPSSAADALLGTAGRHGQQLQPRPASSGQGPPRSRVRSGLTRQPLNHTPPPLRAAAQAAAAARVLQPEALSQLLAPQYNTSLSYNTPLAAAAAAAGPHAPASSAPPTVPLLHLSSLQVELGHGGLYGSGGGGGGAMGGAGQGDGSSEDGAEDGGGDGALPRNPLAGRGVSFRMPLSSGTAAAAAAAPGAGAAIGGPAAQAGSEPPSRRTTSPSHASSARSLAPAHPHPPSPSPLAPEPAPLPLSRQASYARPAATQRTARGPPGPSLLAPAAPHPLLQQNPYQPGRPGSPGGTAPNPFAAYPAAAAVAVGAAAAGSTVPLRARYRAILERVGRVAAQRRREHRRQQALAASASAARLRRGLPEPDSSSDSDGSGGGGASPQGLAAWAGRWRRPLAEAAEAAAAEGEDAANDSAFASRANRANRAAATRHGGGRPGRGRGGAGSDEDEAAAAAAAAAAAEAGYSKRAAAEEAAVLRMARALDELGRFSRLPAVRGAGLDDGSVLAEVDARIAAMQQGDRTAAALAGGRRRGALLPPPPPPFPLAALYEYVAAAGGGVGGLERLAGVVADMRRKLRTVVGTEHEDLCAAAAAALQSIRNAAGPEASAPSTTPAPPYTLPTAPGSEAFAACLASPPVSHQPSTARLGQVPPALPLDSGSGYAADEYGALPSRVASYVGVAQPFMSPHLQGATGSLGLPVGGVGGYPLSSRPAAGSGLAAATRGSAAAGRGGTAGTASGLDRAWTLLESLMIQLHDSYAARADVAAATGQDSTAGGGRSDSLGAEGGAAAAAAPQGSGGGATSSAAVVSAAVSLTSEAAGGLDSALRRGPGGGGGAGASTTRAADRLVKMMNTALELAATADTAGAAGTGGSGGSPEEQAQSPQPPQLQRASVGGAGGSEAAAASPSSLPAAAAADPFAARNALRAAVAGALQPGGTEAVVYFLAQLALMLQQDPALPPDAGFLLAAGLDLLLGEVAWLLALLRAAAGPDSPHLAALAALMGAYEGQRAHGGALAAAAERLALAAEDASDRALDAERHLASLLSAHRSRGADLGDLRVYVSELERQVQELTDRNAALEETVAELEGLDTEAALARAEAAAARRGSLLAAGEALAGALKGAALGAVAGRSVCAQAACGGDAADPRALPHGPWAGAASADGYGGGGFDDGPISPSGSQLSFVIGEEGPDEAGDEPGTDPWVDVGEREAGGGRGRGRGAGRGGDKGRGGGKGKGHGRKGAAAAHKNPAATPAAVPAVSGAALLTGFSFPESPDAADGRTPSATAAGDGTGWDGALPDVLALGAEGNALALAAELPQRGLALDGGPGHAGAGRHTWLDREAGNGEEVTGGRAEEQEGVSGPEARAAAAQVGARIPHGALQGRDGCCDDKGPHSAVGAGGEEAAVGHMASAGSRPSTGRVVFADMLEGGELGRS